MRVHRVFVAQLGQEVKLAASEAAHLRVLRAQVGDAVVAFDGAGLAATGKIVAHDDFETILELSPPEVQSSESPINITLAVALLKGDKLVDVVRACTELGVAKILLLLTDFSDAKEIGAQKLLRLRRVATEAAKQSRRAVVPEILEPVRLSALPDLNAACVGVVAHPGAGALVRSVLSGSVQEVLVLSGPEGGFSVQEIAWLEQKGFVRVGLGPRILRAETAAVALLAALTAAENV